MKHHISEEQMAWLKEGLSQSTARFKIIPNSVAIVDFEPLLGSAGKSDRWQGYSEQREEILGHIEDLRLKVYYGLREIFITVLFLASGLQET